jgi:hypothetical protein
MIDHRAVLELPLVDSLPIGTPKDGERRDIIGLIVHAFDQYNAICSVDRRCRANCSSAKVIARRHLQDGTGRFAMRADFQAHLSNPISTLRQCRWKGDYSPNCRQR